MNILFLGVKIDWVGIGASILQSLRTACGYFVGYIYDFIAVLYNLFMLISKAEFLDNAFVNSIYRKIGLILGIFMVFKLSFSAIQALVDPNKLTDKKSGLMNIIYRCIICIVLLGITPTIFREAFSLQSLLIGSNNSNDNIIYKLIIGGQNVGSVDNFGTTLAGELFFSFYTDDADPYLNLEGSYHESQENLWADVDYDSIKGKYMNPSATQKPESFVSTVGYLSAVDTNGEFCIEFNILFSIVFGIVVAWMIAMYCIQAGIRVVQLAYLQLIAPIPIFSYISDPDGPFKKWIKQCITTYLDLFIRLAIIYFILFLSKNIMWQLNPENLNSLLLTSTGLSSDSPYLIWVKVFLIIGLLLFAKKVPDLLKDLFPNMGGGAAGFSFGLNPKKDVLDPIKHLYNNTPLGWAPKALGGIAKKSISAVDRRVHGLPKPRNKVQQYFDKLTPGRAEEIKNRNQAKLDRKRDERYEAEGEELYNRYGSDLPATAFQSSDYRNSYINLAKAKDLQKEADTEYRSELAKYNRAYNSGDAAAIAIAEKRLKTAEDNQKAMASKVELAQKKHDANKRIYTRDATIEDKHSYYKKTHKERKDYTVDYPSSFQQQSSAPTQPQPQPTTQSQQQAQPQPRSQTTPSQESIPRRPEQYDERIDFATNRYYELQDSGASDDELQQQLDSINALNEGKAEAERYYREVDNHLDEVDERNNDGFGGQ